MKQVCGYLQ